MSRLKHLSVWIVVLSFLLSNTLFAADPPSQPPSSGQDAGARGMQFRDEAVAMRDRAERKKKESPGIEIEEPEEQEVVGADITFVLTGVKIIDATLFEPEDFRPIYEPYLQKKIIFKDLQAITQGIKDKYHAEGYLTTSVYFPEQEIADGRVEIAVLEGKLGTVNVEGNRWFSSDLIRKYIHTKANELLNIKKLQKDILRLNKISDLSVKTVISPGKNPETSDIAVKVTDKFPWHLGMSEDNRGTRLTQKYRTGFYLRSSNLLGLADSIFINTMFNERTFGQFISYVVPIGTYGAKLAVDVSYFKMRLGKEYKVFKYRGKTRTITPHVSFELTLKEDFEAYVDIGINMQDIKKKVGSNRISDDQLRIPYISFDILKTDTLGGGGQTFFSPRFSFGTDGFLGASSRGYASASRDGTGGFYFKYDHVIRRTQRMPFGSYMLLGHQFQTATETLPPSEQLQLGGMTTVRGYPEGDYLADTGATLNIDWVFPMYLFPKSWKLPGSATPLRRMIEPVAFFDMGGGSLRELNTGEARRKFLMGAGGGLRIHFFDRISIRLEWAKAFGDAPEPGNGASTFYMMMQAET